MALWGGVPLVVAVLLFRPHESVVYVGGGSISINTVPPGLPSPLAELCFFYPATLFSVAVLVGLAAWRRVYGARGASQLVELSALFLPTYVAGYESIKLVGWSLRCHDIVNPPPMRDVIAAGGALSGAALVSTVVLCGLAARAFGHRSRVRVPVCPGAVAVVTSVALCWWFLWIILTPPWGNLSMRSYVVVNGALIASVSGTQLLGAALRGYRALRMGHAADAGARRRTSA